MDIPDWLTSILLVLCLIGSAFFSASETAFSCLNKYKFQVEAENGSRTASLVDRLYRFYDSTLITALVGNNIVAIAVSSLATTLFMKFFGSKMDHSAISLLSSLVVAVVTFLFGDTIPKLIAKKAPNVIARGNVYLFSFFFVLFFPVTLIFRGLTALVRKLFRAAPDPEVDTEDIAEEIERMEKFGDIETNESNIMVNSLDFTETSVKEVLTPIRRMKMIDSDGLDTPKLIEFLKTCSYSRVPVYYKSRDKIVGVLVVKNFLSAYFKNPSTSYLPFVQKAYFVTPRVKMDDLLDGFKEHHTQIAIVRKEGKVLGMVTTEDVLEELVGRIDEVELSPEEVRP